MMNFLANPTFWTELVGPNSSPVIGWVTASSSCLRLQLHAHYTEQEKEDTAAMAEEDFNPSPTAGCKRKKWFLKRHKKKKKQQHQHCIAFQRWRYECVYGDGVYECAKIHYQWFSNAALNHWGRAGPGFLLFSSFKFGLFWLLEIVYPAFNATTHLLCSKSIILQAESEQNKPTRVFFVTSLPSAILCMLFLQQRHSCCGETSTKWCRCCECFYRCLNSCSYTFH